MHRVWFVGIFNIVIDPLEASLGSRVLQFQTRHQERRLAAGGEDEGDRPLGGDKGEARVVEDVIIVEEDGGIEFLRPQMLGQAGPAGGELSRSNSQSWIHWSLLCQLGRSRF